MDPLRLAGLVGSRICHDLISPVGAVGNGLELMRMADGGGEEEMDLLASSAETATATLSFLRVAFGGQPEDDMVPLAQVESVAAAYFALKRLTLDWSAEPAQALPYGEARLRLLLALAAAAALPRGGALTLMNGAETGWRGEGDKLISADRAAAAMRTAPDIWTAAPGDAHFVLIWRHAELRNATPFWRANESGVEVGIG